MRRRRGRCPGRRSPSPDSILPKTYFSTVNAAGARAMIIGEGEAVRPDPEPDRDAQARGCSSRSRRGIPDRARASARAARWGSWRSVAVGHPVVEDFCNAARRVLADAIDRTGLVGRASDPVRHVRGRPAGRRPQAPSDWVPGLASDVRARAATPEDALGAAARRRRTSRTRCRGTTPRPRRSRPAPSRAPAAGRAAGARQRPIRCGPGVRSSRDLLITPVCRDTPSSSTA